MDSKQTYFTFEDTLTQIGLGYPVLFLLGYASRRVQVVALVGILVAYWAAFALYPLPDASFNYAAAGVPPNWEHNLQGLSAHWNKNTNLAWAFDKWFLNLFPREQVFTNNGGGYATLSFIPTLGTMILGLLAGATLKSGSSNAEKVRQFVLLGMGLLALGLLCHVAGVNPIVKRIWTPAWVLYSGGCCFLLLGVFYGIIDGYQVKGWSFPLMVIGMNSIAAYVMAHTISSFISNSLSIHLGPQWNYLLGNVYAPFVGGFAVLLVEFLILYWMYKRKLFIKI